jgi:hypothetical protein
MVALKGGLMRLKSSLIVMGFMFLAHAAGAEESDIGKRVKSIALEYSASTVWDERGAHYTIFSQRIFRGNATTILSYSEYRDGTSILFMIFRERSEDGTFHLTALTDIGAKGKPDYRFEGAGCTPEEAQNDLVRDQPGLRVLPEDEKAYDAYIALLKRQISIPAAR